MKFSNGIELPFDCEQLFNLVADVERYPDFLPHWADARVLCAEGNRLYVQQQLRAGIVPISFHTTAVLEHHSHIHIRAEDGPFSRFDIHWDFTPSRGRGSCIRVHTEIQFEAGLLRQPMERMFRHTSGRLVSHFERRARSLYP